jgi:hypothetical protein
MASFREVREKECHPSRGWRTNVQIGATVFRQSFDKRGKGIGRSASRVFYGHLSFRRCIRLLTLRVGSPRNGDLTYRVCGAAMTATVKSCGGGHPDYFDITGTNRSKHLRGSNTRSVKRYAHRGRSTSSRRFWHTDKCSRATKSPRATVSEAMDSTIQQLKF